VPPASANANIAEWLWVSARAWGARPAIIERRAALDYAALLARAASIAAALAGASVGADDTVAIFLESGTDVAAAFFAALSLGAVAVVIGDTLLPRQVEYILGDVQARCLVTSRALLDRQPRGIRCDAPVIATDMAVLPGQPPPVLARRRDDDIAQIIYTSGSTGQPKGVMVSHGNLRAAVAAVTSYLALDQTDRLAGLLPLAHVYGMSQLLCACALGATLVIDRSPLTRDVAESLRAHRITVVAGVPTLWMRLLRHRSFTGAPLPDLRVITNAGGHLPVSAVRALRQAQPAARLFLMYGMTETLRSTYLPPEEVDRRPDSIGRAIPGAEIDVVRHDGTPAAPGEVGELVYRGPTVTLGYWRNPAATARVFIPVPGAGGARAVHTGDFVRRDADGFLVFVSRRDRLIKSSGYRVGPDEVTDALHDSGEVAEAIVTGERDADCGMHIVAYVVLAPGGSLDRLRAFCGRELAPHLRPARIEVRATLPTLPSGKYDLDAATSGTT
jgi:amino acid adenylation domain-containing protein